MKWISLLGAAGLALAARAALPSVASAAEPNVRYQGGDLRFDHPAGWKVEPAADVSAELALRLQPPTGAALLSATLLVGTRRVTDQDLDAASAEWHAAHLRNRAAWGMHLAGGLPRDPVQLGGRRALRYRDRVGGALGASEQTLTCVTVGARLACVLVSAPAGDRDAADALAATVLSSLSIKTRR